jgi:hypothetical protein
MKGNKLYRSRTLTKGKIHGKFNEQYSKLWDYCEIIRRRNIDSCIVMKVERPLPDLPSKFQRWYFSLAAMKNGFLVSCRPIIWLKWMLLERAT